MLRSQAKHLWRKKSHNPTGFLFLFYKLLLFTYAPFYSRMTRFPYGIYGGISHLSTPEVPACTELGRANPLWGAGPCVESSRSSCSSEGVCTWVTGVCEGHHGSVIMSFPEAQPGWYRPMRKSQVLGEFRVIQSTALQH